MLPPSVQLRVQKIEQSCLFECTWGNGQRVSAILPFPADLDRLFQTWQHCYLSFYQTAQLPLAPPPPGDKPLRGRTIATGNLTSYPVDWQARLIEAETALLQAFHHWLRSAELYELRSAIRRAVQTQPTPILFLSCSPLALARLPWETWEMSADGAATPIAIVRSAATVRTASGQPRQLRRGRVLAILGDETGLNFQADRVAVQALTTLAEVVFVGWQPGQTPAQVKQQIQQALGDRRGWDILFFAGHSNETVITGGELAIAPGVSLQISEIAPQLAIARNNGLQVGIFNSCSGLNIAESLIDLGLSQVVVMREPIHNRVAQVVLLLFLQQLSQNQTVVEALKTACHHLQRTCNLTYPSAHLVPSLFCHPGAPLFRLPRLGWQQSLRQVLPTRWQGAVLAICLVLSLVPSLQTTLLELRLLAQAAFRDRTGQLPALTTPPVFLVQIDETSIRKDSRLSQPNPISRSYLADLLRSLSQRQARVIGIDYLLDRRVGDEPQLGQVVQQAINQHQAWFIFATVDPLQPGAPTFVTAESQIARPESSLQGFIESSQYQLMLPLEGSHDAVYPFAYLLALAAQTRSHPTTPQPAQERRNGLQQELLSAIDGGSSRLGQNPTLASLRQLRQLPLTQASYNLLSTPWLAPLIDWSIPPDRIYRRLAAWRLLQPTTPLPDLSNQVVLLIPGGYGESGGLGTGTPDSIDLPLAVQYWRDRLPLTSAAAGFPLGNSQNSPAFLSLIPGGELHAYSLHHFLTRHFVVPLPDVWFVLLAGLLGKALVLFWRSSGHPPGLVVAYVLGSGIYALVSLQLYVSAHLLIPIMFPVVVTGLYLLPMNWK